MCGDLKDDDIPDNLENFAGNSPPTGRGDDWVKHLASELMPQVAPLVEKILTSLRHEERRQKIEITPVEGGYILEVNVLAPLDGNRQEYVNLLLLHADNLLDSVKGAGNQNWLVAARDMFDLLQTQQQEGRLLTRAQVRTRVVTSIEDIPHAIAMLLSNDPEGE